MKRCQPDDAVIVPQQNEAFFEKHAAHSLSSKIIFHTEPADALPKTRSNNTVSLPGFSEEFRVAALTHVSPHVSPRNPHYGLAGSYRNCGTTAPRDQSLVDACLAADDDDLWYGLWDSTPPPGQPRAMSTFNPQFDKLGELIGEFLEQLSTAS